MYQINLDNQSVGDAADLIPGFICESYWIGKIIADVYRPWHPETSDLEDEYKPEPIASELCHWFFGNNWHQPLDKEQTLLALGLSSTDEIEVNITLESGEKYRLPYRTAAVSGKSFAWTREKN